MSADERTGHSRAFENLVTLGDGDIVGLLAYALFKQAIREAAIGGNAPPGGQRNPSPTTVKVHRDAAEQMLSGLVDNAIEAARPDLEASALRQAVDDSRAAVIATANEINAHNDQRTRFWPAVLAGMIAWVGSLILTVLIIWLSGRGDAVSALLK